LSNRINEKRINLPGAKAAIHATLQADKIHSKDLLRLWESFSKLGKPHQKPMKMVFITRRSHFAKKGIVMEIISIATADACEIKGYTLVQLTKTT
jgi:hypothetical protein